MAMHSMGGESGAAPDSRAWGSSDAGDARRDRPDRDEPARELEAALARARRHARNAVAEALEAGRALLDAASLATAGASADAHPLFARADRWIRDASQRIAAEDVLSGNLAAVLADALDAEIARWEERARVDPDARAVLRAFLGVRELLWELGVRPDAAARARSAAPRERARPRTSADTVVRRRVERVAVEG